MEYNCYLPVGAVVSFKILDSGGRICDVTEIRQVCISAKVHAFSFNQLLYRPTEYLGEINESTTSLISELGIEISEVSNDKRELLLQ